VAQGETAAQKCQGEYESLKAIDAVSPGFVPRPHAWGRCKDGGGGGGGGGGPQASASSSSSSFFLLEDFRDILEQVSSSQCPSTFPYLRLPQVTFVQRGPPPQTSMIDLT
jgi:hypothetical protein